jgi:hypothetical protein
MAPVVDAYQAMRGVSFIVAVTFVAEIPDILRIRAELGANTRNPQNPQWTPTAGNVRGFGDHKLYQVLTDDLKFDYLIRFRGNIKVTAADGEARYFSGARSIRS